MNNSTDEQATIVFDQARAASYDRRMARFAPVRENLHLLLRLILSGLPDDARVLCVGVGSGEELLALAKACPGWHFTAVEPAAPMMALCRQRAEDQGIAARVTFHEGYLETLPECAGFDAATSILVSHFILQQDKRQDFFRAISGRMKPGAILVSADLASEMASAQYQSLLQVWMQMQQYAGMTKDELTEHRNALGEAVAVLPPVVIEEMISQSGFTAPVLFFQSLLIHGWYMKRL